MDKKEIALARYHSYHLIGNLYLQGVSPDLLPYVQAVPELASALTTPIELDEMAAEHYRLFGMNVFPYESIFLDSSGLVGGNVTDGVVWSYRRIGYGEGTAVDTPDHIGHELLALAGLCRAEALAEEKGEASPGAQNRAWQREFLQEHLLRWLAPFFLVVREQNSPFFTAVADLTLELTAHHYAELVEGTATPSIASFLPSPPPLLDDEKAGLREIARYLLTPAYSGLYISRGDIDRLARGQKLPRGFGDRQQMLLNLMRTAVQYDKLPALMVTLRRFTQEWERAYRQISLDNPELAPFTAVWKVRTTHTTQILTQIELTIHH